jgi:PAS domain S-box-containing protein
MPRRAADEVDASNELMPAGQVHVMAKRTPILLALAIFLLSLVATYGLWNAAQEQAKRALQADFDFKVRQSTRRVEQRMVTYEQVTRGTRAFLLGSMDVRREDFHLFFESLQLAEKFPGIQGLALVKIVPRPLMEQHVAEVRAEGFPNYHIHPASERELYSSIIQIEPFSGLNLRAHGFDMLTNPVRREAMERARDTGQAAASGKVKLIQENGQQEQSGLVMYLPVYRRNTPVSTLEERRANIIGWVGAPFRMNDLMAGLGGERSSDIVLSIYDGDAVTEDALLYRHSGSDGSNGSNGSNGISNADKGAVLNASAFKARRSIMVAGRPWILDIQSSPSYEAGIDQYKPRFIAIAGSGVGALLAVLVWTLASGRRRALNLATAITVRLRESEFRWKYALEGAGDGVWDWNNQTGEVLFSKRWCAMLGYDPSEIKNHISEWERLLHPEDKAHALEAAKIYMQGKQPYYTNEYRMLCKDGSWKWMLTRGMAVSLGPEGQVLRTIGTHTEITLIKQQEAALRQSNQQLAAEKERVKIILEKSHDAFVALDSDGRVTDWNAKAEATFGWTSAEALGQDLAELIVPPDMRNAHTAGFRRFARTGKATLTQQVVEVPALHRSGKIFPVELAVAGFPGASGYAVSAFIRDISTRKEAERLEAERSRALHDAREALQHAQKLEAVGKLTGGVAHDFNNVLQVISGNIQLLQYTHSDDPALMHRLAGVLSAVDRGSKLSGQLLAFARRQPLQPVVLNLAQTVGQLDELLQRAVGESVVIRTKAPAQPWNTLVDRSQLENVILNLALNARDAMSGGGELDILLDNIRIDDGDAGPVTDLPPGEYVMLALTDSGCGMSDEVIAQAFEPFFTTKPVGEGTGLGLSMAYGFVKQTGGDIRIESREGQGTTVRIFLPRSKQTETQKPLPAIDAVTGGSETVLVVEDDLDVQESVAGMLTALGYHVLRANNGEEALRIVENGTAIDLLFTDVVMPGPVSSPELAERVKKILPDVAILFTSGYTRNALTHGGRLQEGVQLLSKPYRQEQLAQKVREVLGRFKKTGT